MNTLAKKHSPFTHSVGAGKYNATVTLSEQADELLAKVADELGESRNCFIRQAIALRAATIRTGKALALKAAIAAQDRHAVYSLIAAIFIGAIEVRSWVSGDDAPEFRRARVTRTARVVRGREGEVCV